jgi:hypothetical protein
LPIADCRLEEGTAPVLLRGGLVVSIIDDPEFMLWKSPLKTGEEEIGNRQLAMLSSNGFRLNAVLVKRRGKFLGDF